MIGRHFGLLLCPPLLIAAAPAARPVAYSISPVMTGDQLNNVTVAVRFRADRSGRTILQLPDAYGGVKKHWRYLSGFVVEGGNLSSPSPAQRLIKSVPNANVTVRYRVSTAYNHDPDASGGNTYDGAIIRPDWFASLGEFLFAVPKDRQSAPARIRWTGWPRGWITASSTDHHAATVVDIQESSVLAGPGVQMRSRPIEGGTLRLVSHGAFDWSMDGYADRVASVISVERKFWNEADGDYMVTFLKLAPSPGVSSSGGTGRKHAFVQYASPDTLPDMLFRNIAHEYAHNWIAPRIGEVPDDERAAAFFWLSEGFTDFYAARILLRSGLRTPQQFADDLNRTLFRLASSPAKDYPNERIVKQFWADPAVGQLPYDRGNLFAHLLDYELRRSGKPRLDQVLFAMRDRWVAAPANAKPALLDNFYAVLDAGGFDARPLVREYIENAKPIELPADLFGRCAELVTTSVPALDRGYDREASSKAHAFAGVDPNGPAYAAGLRDGMVRLAYLGGGEDSRLPISFRVRDGQSERVLTWLPAGKTRLQMQELTLAPGAASGSDTHCISELSGLTTAH